jgi:hypothetical protein
MERAGARGYFGGDAAERAGPGDDTTKCVRHGSAHLCWHGLGKGGGELAVRRERDAGCAVDARRARA